MLLRATVGPAPKDVIFVQHTLRRGRVDGSNHSDYSLKSVWLGYRLTIELQGQGAGSPLMVIADSVSITLSGCTSRVETWVRPTRVGYGQRNSKKTLGETSPILER